MSEPLQVAHLIGSTGLYGAERWVLAMLAHLPPERVRATLVNLVDQAGEESEVVRVARSRGLAAVDLYTGGRFSPGSVARVARLVRERQVRVLHSHGYKSDLLGLLAARRAGVRIVATPHGWSPRAGARVALYEGLDRLALRLVDRVCPLSPALRDGLRRLGVPARKLRMILNAVDLEEVDRIPPAPDPRPAPVVVGFVGQLIPRKNVACLVAAFAELAAGRPDVGLLVVGDGPERAALEGALARSGLRERARLTGFRADGVALLKTLDVLVLPSWEEGIPRCLMEAMAAGVPVVASDIPGNRDLVRPGDTGLLFPPADPARLAAALGTLLAEPGQARAMARRARALVERDFSARRMAEEYAELYEAC